MKITFSHLYVLLTIIFVGFFDMSQAQSAFFVYKNLEKGKTDFAGVWGMPSRADAEFLARQKLEEQTNDNRFVIRQATTDKPGFGIIIQSYVIRKDKRLSIYGAGLGCASYKEAEQTAVKNLKDYNPDWPQSNYEVIEKFNDSKGEEKSE